MATPRVSPPRVFPEAGPAPRPPMGSPAADAYRQASFVLGADVELVLRGLDLESGIARASSGAKLRTQRMVATLGLWSRAWLCRLQALHAVQWGSYAAAFPLLRAAADLQAAAIATVESGAAEWEAWLQADGVALAPDVHAAEFRLHAFRAGEVLASNEVLGRVYRAASDLSLPHFGATLLLAGHGSDPARIAMTFGDRDFHLGLAEVLLGWLVELSALQLEDASGWTGAFAVDDPAGITAFVTAARAVLARPDRCRIDEIERHGERRYLVHHWRARPGAAPKKVLL